MIAPGDSGVRPAPRPAERRATSLALASGASLAGPAPARFGRVVLTYQGRRRRLCGGRGQPPGGRCPPGPPDTFERGAPGVASRPSPDGSSCIPLVTGMPPHGPGSVRNPAMRVRAGTFLLPPVLYPILCHAPRIALRIRGVGESTEPSSGGPSGACRLPHNAGVAGSSPAPAILELVRLQRLDCALGRGVCHWGDADTTGGPAVVGGDDPTRGVRWTAAADRGDA